MTVRTINFTKTRNWHIRDQTRGFLEDSGLAKGNGYTQRHRKAEQCQVL